MGRLGNSERILARIWRRIEIMRLIFSFVSAVGFTVFTLIMLNQNWGKTVYLYIVMGLIGAYILIFFALVLIALKSKGRIRSTLKYYKSGLKILKSILTIIGFSITASLVSITIFADINSFFRFLVLISSLLWAVFQIIYQIYKLSRNKRKPKTTRKHIRLNRK